MYRLVYSPVVAYLYAACHQLEAVLTGIGLSHHRVSPREFLVQGNNTVLKIVLRQTFNGHINLEPLHTHKEPSKSPPLILINHVYMCVLCRAGTNTGDEALLQKVNAVSFVLA